MPTTKIHKVVDRMISVFYLIGFWHRGDKPTVRELRIKLFYCIYYSLFFVSLVTGAIQNENIDVSIFLAEISVTAAVFGIKISILIWKQYPIIALLNRICVYSIRDDEDFSFVNKKLTRFMKFVIFFIIIAVVHLIGAVGVLPFIGSERISFLEIGFPLDYKNSEIAFWISNFFIFTELILSLQACFVNVIISYLLLNCSLRYEVLGNKLKKIGKFNGKISHNLFLQDLRASIDDHVHLRELTNELGSFFSNVFFVQCGTSGLCICGSIYCLAFGMADNLAEWAFYIYILLYFVAELFMITYFGNEIMLSSDRLSYSLFESDWIDQPQSTKKCIIIFGENLKQPQVLIIGKLYPLTLEIFKKILNSAYSMFNILKSIRK